MKKYASNFLKFIALFLIGFPITFPLITTVSLNIDPSHWFRILLQPFYYIISIVTVTCGFALIEMRRWAWHLLVPTNILITYSSAVLATNYSQSNYSGYVFILSILIQVFVFSRLTSELRVPYIAPRTRWWESNPRYRFRVAAKIGESFVEILDLSGKGAFIKTREPFDLHQQIQLQFELFGTNFNLPGRVLNVASSGVTHPQGIGIMFEPANRFQKRLLRRLHKRLGSVFALYNSIRFIISSSDFQRLINEKLTLPLRGKKVVKR